MAGWPLLGEIYVPAPTDPGNQLWDIVELRNIQFRPLAPQRVTVKGGNA